MNEEDEDIRLFREDYPDVYDFVLKVLEGNCDDAALQLFTDDYGEGSLEDFLKIISGKASEKDIQSFREEYSEEIYNAIVKMIQNRKPQREDLPESVPSREKFKKGDIIGQNIKAVIFSEWVDLVLSLPDDVKAKIKGVIVKDGVFCM